jgi:hypothetical protein
MNDYLRRAIERETSAAPAVRPALPSLFDPGMTSAIGTALETESPIEGEPSRSAPHETKPEISSLPEPLAAVNALWPDPAIGAPEQPRKREEAAEETSVGLAVTPIAPAVTAASTTESLLAKQPQLPGAEARQLAGTPVVDARPRAIQAPGETIVRPTADAAPNPLQTATEAIVRPPGDPRPGPSRVQFPQSARARQLRPLRLRLAQRAGAAS